MSQRFRRLFGPGVWGRWSSMSIRPRLVLGLLATLAVALTVPGFSSASDGADAHVDVFNTGYEDADSGTVVTSIGTGDTVTWIWTSGTHTVSAGDGFATGGPFDSPRKAPSDEDPTFSVTFDEAGVFPYYCELHASMRGVVVVA